MNCVIFCILLAIAVFVIKIQKFNKTTYHKITGNLFFYTFHNLGARGEYETFKKLSYLEKTVANFYLIFTCPKKTAKQPKWMLF